MHLYYISSMSKHVHVDEKNDMVNKYNNNIYYRTSDAGVENNKKILNLGDHVRTWKYKSIFAKIYSPNWSDKVFAIKKVKNTVT